MNKFFFGSEEEILAASDAVVEQVGDAAVETVGATIENGAVLGGYTNDGAAGNAIFGERPHLLLWTELEVKVDSVLSLWSDDGSGGVVVDE